MTVMAMTPLDATSPLEAAHEPPDPWDGDGAHPGPRPRVPADEAAARTGGVVTACGSCLVVAGGPGGLIRVVDAADPAAPPRVLGRHGSPVAALAALDGLVFSAGCDGRVLAWRLAGSRRLPVVVGGHAAGVTAAGLAPDGALVTAAHDGQVLAWRRSTPELLGTHAGGVEAVTVLGSGVVVTAGRDGRLVRHGAGTGTAEVGEAIELRQRRREITVAMTGIGRAVLATATGQLGVVRLWEDLSDGARPEILGLHGGWVLALVPLGPGHVAAVGGHRVSVWDLRSGDGQRLELDPPLHAVSGVALDSGDLAVSGPGGLRLVPVSRLALPGTTLPGGLDECARMRTDPALSPPTNVGSPLKHTRGS